MKYFIIAFWIVSNGVCIAGMAFEYFSNIKDELKRKEFLKNTSTYRDWKKVNPHIESIRGEFLIGFVSINAIAIFVVAVILVANIIS